MAKRQTPASTGALAARRPPAPQAAPGPRAQPPAANIQRAAWGDPQRLAPADILQLQHALGNRTVGQLLHGPRQQPAVAETIAPAPGEPALQRKVGFEFETNIPVRTADHKQIIAKHFALLRAKNSTWTVTPDASFMEIVTVPFEEEGEHDQLLKLMDTMVDIELFAEAMIRAGQRHKPADDVPLREFGASFGKVALFDSKEVIVERLGEDISRYGVTAAPQATGGVRPENIPALIDKIVTTKLDLYSGYEHINPFGDDPKPRAEDEKTLSGMRPDHGALLQEARQSAQFSMRLLRLQSVEMNLPAKEWDKLVGLMALVISYLLMGDRQDKVWPYSKLIAPLMSRTNFSALYGALHDQIKPLFSTKNVLDAAGLSGTGAQQVYKLGFKEAKDAEVSYGPTRGAWIASIIAGNDLMSAGGGSTVTTGMRASSPEMGAKARLDRSVEGLEELVLLELRRLPKEQQWNEWASTAIDIFLLFREIQGPTHRELAIQMAEKIAEEEEWDEDEDLTILTLALQLEMTKEQLQEALTLA